MINAAPPNARASGKSSLMIFVGVDKLYSTCIILPIFFVAVGVLLCSHIPHRSTALQPD